MKANMYAIPATDGYTDIIAKVLMQNTAVDSYGLNPSFKLLPDERIVYIAISSEGNKNWAQNGIPKKIAGRCAPAFKLPEFWPARCFEGLEDGESIVLSINGHDVELIAAQSEYPEVALSFKDAVAAFLIESAAQEHIHADGVGDAETSVDTGLATQTETQPATDADNSSAEASQAPSEEFTMSTTTCLIGGALIALAACSLVYIFKRN